MRQQAGHLPVWETLSEPTGGKAFGKNSDNRGPGVMERSGGRRE